MTQPSNRRFVMEDRIGAVAGVQGYDDDLQGISNATLNTAGVVKTNGSSIYSSSLITASDIDTGTITGTQLASADLAGLSNDTLTVSGFVKTDGASVFSVDVTNYANKAGETFTGDIVAPNVISGTVASNHVTINGNTIRAFNGASASDLFVGNNSSGENIVVQGGTSVTFRGPLISAQNMFTASNGLTVYNDGLSNEAIVFSGTALKSNPNDGTMEADANAIYSTTKATHGRGVIPSMLFSSGTKTYASSASVQNLFPVATDTLAMAANTTYMVEGLIQITVPATSSAAHTMSLTLNGGTAATTGQVMCFATQNNTAANAIPTAASSYLMTGTSALTIWATASTAATACYRTVYFNGIIRCTTAGTFIPQFTTSIASVAIPAGNVNNYITLNPIGANTAVSSGKWS
jgi:hypothetical protein